MEKIDKKMNKKVNKALRKEVGSLSAIIFFQLCSFTVWLLTLILFVLIALIPQKDIITFELNILSHKSIVMVIMFFTYFLIFAMFLKKKIVIKNTKDFIQKFIIVCLAFTCLGTFMNLRMSKKSYILIFQLYNAYIHCITI